MSQQERIAQAKIAVDIAQDNSKQQLEERKIASKDQIEGFRIGQEIAKDMLDE